MNIKKISISNCIVIIFYIALMIFTIYALFYKSINRYFSNYKFDGKCAILLISLIVLILIFTLFNRVINRLPKIVKYFYFPLLIYIIAYVINILIINSIGIGTNQVSEFKAAFEASKYIPPLNSEYYRIFSNWALYVKYIQILKIFGDSVIFPIIMNGVITSLSSVLIYYITILTLNTEAAILSSLIFTFIPIHLLYVIVLSPEFVNIFLLLLGILTFILSFKLQKKNKYIMSFFLVFISGIVLSLSGFFKEIDKILLISIIIWYLINYLKFNKPSFDFKHISTVKSKRLSLIILLLISYFATTNLMYFYLDKFIGDGVNRYISTYYVYIGLNPVNMGTLKVENNEMYIKEIQESNYDFKQTSNDLYEKLKSEINESKNLNFTNFNKKLDISWAGADYFESIEGTISDENISEIHKENIAPLFGNISQLYYVIICAFMVLGIIACIMKREKGYILLFSLFIFGFALFSAIWEVQARYKCVIYPYISVLASYGIIFLISLIRREYKNRNANTNSSLKKLK